MLAVFEKAIGVAFRVPRIAREVIRGIEIENLHVFLRCDVQGRHCLFAPVVAAPS
jgi:hypothetical protein